MVSYFTINELLNLLGSQIGHLFSLYTSRGYRTLPEPLIWREELIRLL